MPIIMQYAHYYYAYVVITISNYPINVGIYWVVANSSFAGKFPQVD
jgi:hypothetical protein